MEEDTTTATTTVAAAASAKINVLGRSIDDFLSSFAYKKEGDTTATATTTTNDTAVTHSGSSFPLQPLKSPFLSRTVRGRARSATDRKRPAVDGGLGEEAAEEADKGPVTPPPISPLLHNLNKNRKRRRTTATSHTSAAVVSTSSSSPFPSSYIRTTVGGKPVVVSPYFPLPPDADSSPVFVKKKKKSRSSTLKTPSVEKKKKKKRKQKSCDDNNGAADAVIDGHDDLKEGEKSERRKKKKKKKPAAPYLSAVEKKSDAYKRIDPHNMWEPPASCHKLLQERHSFDPWRVLIICMLLNVTTGRQVAKVLPGLFLLCPNAEVTVNTSEEEIEKVIQSLGLQKKRARMIKQFSSEYLGDDWTHVTQLHGIGKYAADAYAIFCIGKPEAVTPQDHKLVDYWKFVCGKDDTM